MRAFRSPSHLPGLTIAAVALAAVAIIFATAGGLVAFHFQTADSPQEARRPLVLRAPPPGLTVRVPAPEPAPAPARAAPSRPAPRLGAASPIRSSPGDAPRGVAPSSPTVVPTPGAARRLPQSQEPPPRPAAPAPSSPRAPQRSAPLRPVGDLVDKTTTEVARGLRATTRALAERTELISPVLAMTVTQAGQLLGDVVEGIGRSLGILLGVPRTAAPGPPPA